jgi:LPS-assembly lipoprotein
MTKFFRIFCAIFAAAFLLTSCGFNPLYGGGKNAEMAQQRGQDYNLSIAVIPNQEGVLLRNLLIDLFYKNGYPQSPRYDLVVSPVTETEVSLAIAKTSESTRSQLRQVAHFELRDRATNSVVLARDISAISSYNILVSEFATRVTEKNARENGLKDLARQIELQLGLYFKNSQNNQ